MLHGGFTKDPGFKGKPSQRDVKCHEFSVKNVILKVSPTQFHCEAKVYLMTGKYAENHIYGPASSLSDKSVIYPCRLFKCRLRCPCHRCRKGCNKCTDPDHELLPGGGCSECQDDYWEHFLFHLVEHTSCKFCRSVASILPHKKCQVSETRGYYPNFYKVMIDSFLVKHYPKFLKTDSITNQHSCDKCEESFHSESNLRRHEKEIHFGGKLQCESCGKQFFRKHQLDMHMKTLHEEHGLVLLQFQCERCRKCFQDKFSFERHSGSSQTCDVCASTFCTLKHLTAHKKIDHGSFTCQNCGKFFRDGDKLKKHQNFIECEECLEQICNGQEMRKHMKLHKESHTCSFCGKIMACKRWMDEHVERRTDHSCSLCGKMFCYIYELCSHKATHHMTEKCKECGRMVLEGKMLSHIDEQHKNKLM